MTNRTPDPTPDGFVVASRTDVGQVRAANEDSCASAIRADGAQLMLVADGMGGHRGGATASQTAAALISERFNENPSAPITELLRSSIESANERIYAQSTMDPELEGMGTTLVALVVDSALHGFVAHVGDSRAYRARGERFEALTFDHSVVAEMLKRGLLTPEEAAKHPRRNEILRSVGVLPEVEVESAEIDVQPGDRYLLCSDGLTGLVDDAEIAEILASESPEDAVTSLIDLANERGGFDNITVQVLVVSDSFTRGECSCVNPSTAETQSVAASLVHSEQTNPGDGLTIPPVSTRRPRRGRWLGFALVIAALLGVAYFTL